MLFYGRAQKVAVFAVDTATGIGKTGDVSNFTLKVSKDGAANAAASNTPTEIGYGLYSLELTAAECSADLVCVSGVSSTSGVSVSPIIATTEAQAIPYAVAGSSTGLALTSSVDDVETKTDGIKTVTDALPDAGALTSLATAAAVATVDAVVDGLATTLTDVKGSGFDTATDSLEAVRNRGDAAWITASGFSTHSAADVWSVGTRTLSAFGFAVDVGTIESGDATTALETAATNSLNSYDPPTKAEIDTAFVAVQGSGFDTATDSLEAVRNRGDAAWITASGFNTTTPPSASAVADAVWDELQSAHTTSGTFGYYLDAQVSSAAAPPTAAAIADAVWDELTSAHTVSGSYGKAIGDGISDWVTASGFSTFNASSDTVANVTTVGSVSGTVSADVVSVSGDSTAAANLEADYDGTGYSKTNSTIGTTTTNTDMRGTDSALLAASVPTNFGSLAITGAGKVTAGTVDDKAGYSISGTITTLDGLNNVSVADVWTTQLTESYASEGTAPTAAQALFLSQAMDGEKSISGTTVTLKKLDQSTTSATYTLDSSTAPTSITRAT